MDQASDKTLQFPRSPSFDATRWQILRNRFILWVAKRFHRTGAPGLIESCEINDPVSGQQIEVRVGEMATEITVGCRSFRFDRMTGRLVGMGSHVRYHI